MRQEWGVVNKERALLLRGRLDELIDWLEPFAADRQAVITMASAPRSIAVGHAVGKATSLEAAFPPLTGLMADISFGLELFRQLRYAVDVLDVFDPSL